MVLVLWGESSILEPCPSQRCLGGDFPMLVALGEEMRPLVRVLRVNPRFE